MKKNILTLFLLAAVIVGCAAPQGPAAPTAASPTEAAPTAASASPAEPTAESPAAVEPTAVPTPSGPVLTVGDGTTTRTFSMDELAALGASQAAFRDVSYTGVPLAEVLRAAGFNPDSLRAVKAIASDGFSVNYEPALVNRADTLVAYARADGPLAEDELPFRMVLPDQEGKLNPRQLVELKVVP